MIGMPGGPQVAPALQMPGLKSLTQMPVKQANAPPRRGFFSNAYNAAFGKDPLSRLDSWSAIQHRMPGFVRNHVNNKVIAPQVQGYVDQVRNAFMGPSDGMNWRERVSSLFGPNALDTLASLPGTGLLAGAGLGAYSLYKGLKQTPQQPGQLMPRQFNVGSSSPRAGTVNSNLGLDNTGRPLGKMACVSREEYLKLAQLVLAEQEAEKIASLQWLYDMPEMGPERERSKQLVTDWLGRKGITPNIPDDIPLEAEARGPCVFPGRVVPEKFGLRPNTIFNSKDHAGMMAHEGGHIANHYTKKKLFKAVLRNENAADTAASLTNSVGTLSHLGSVFASPLVAAFAPVNSSAARNAWKMPLYGGAYTLAGEGVASLRGLNEIRRQRGIGAALTGMIFLLLPVLARLLNVLIDIFTGEPAPVDNRPRGT